MVTIEIAYQGELRTLATHAPSGATLHTDAPVDNHGKGQSFSPTDLVATALGSCMLTVMGIVAERHAWDLKGTRVTVIKEMATAPVRRIGKLTVRIAFATRCTPEQRTTLQQAALACPVHKSLHPDVATPIEFVFPE